MEFINIENGITHIQSGIIVHQVNCMNRIGGGISGAFCKLYPIVEKKYHEICDEKGAKGVFGTYQEVPVSEALTIVNMFSQFGYGNPKRTGKQYTNYDAVVNCLTEICNTHPNEKIYIPEFIGCGLGGGDWTVLTQKIQHLPVIIVKKPANIR